MMSAYILVEAPRHADIVKRVLLPVLPEGVHVASGSGRSSAISLAHSLLIDRDRPTLLLLDADTSNPSRVREQQVVVGDLLSRPRARTEAHVIFAVPEFEGVLFAEPSMLGAIMGVEVTPEQRARAEYAPRAVIEELLLASPRVRSWDALIGAVDDGYAARMRAHPIFQEARDYLQAAFTAEAVSAEAA